MKDNDTSFWDGTEAVEPAGGAALIATFGPNASAGYVGRSLVCQGGMFAVAGGEPLTIEQVLAFDRAGVLIWVSEEARDRVCLVASSPDSTAESTPAAVAVANAVGEARNCCTDCGTKLPDQPKFCPNCGAKIPESNITSPPSRPTAAQPACEKSSSTPMRGTAGGRRGALVAIGLFFVLLVAVAIQQGTARQTQFQATADNNARLASALRVLNTNDSGTLQSDLLAWQLNGYSPYASVGWAADYPNRCLVTIVLPPPASAAKQVVFDPSSTNAYNFIASPVNPSTLPDSVKQWNATVDRRGYVLLNGYEQSSLPAGESQ